MFSFFKKDKAEEAKRIALENKISHFEKIFIDNGFKITYWANNCKFGHNKCRAFIKIVEKISPNGEVHKLELNTNCSICFICESIYISHHSDPIPIAKYLFENKSEPLNKDSLKILLDLAQKNVDFINYLIELQDISTYRSE